MPGIKIIKKIVILVSLIFIALFLTAGFVFRSNYVVPILMYHSVCPDAHAENRLAISERSFQRQMRFLKEHHYNVLSLEELANLMHQKKKIPPKTVVLTFDDGYRDNYFYAFPVLKKYNLCATIFIIINEVVRVGADRLNWDEIKLMQDSGLITFGSHCLGAEPLVNIASEEELKKQIFDSQRILEERLARKVSCFSYPEGRFNRRIRQLVIDAGYKVAVATNPGARFPDDDIFALKRIRISSSSDNLFVFWVETSGYYNFIREHRHK